MFRSTSPRALLIGLWFGLWLAFATACAKPATARPARPVLDAERYPTLLEALQRQRPSLLSGRGGSLVLVVNGIREPWDALRDIPTKWVLKVERVIGDVTQVGSVTTLRVTMRDY